MPTRKKVVARNGSQEHASPTLCRLPKVSVIAEKKFKELITSVKKQKSAGIHVNEIRDVEEARVLTPAFGSTQEEVECGTNLGDEMLDGRTAKCLPNTIFSPAYHHPKDGFGVATDKADFIKFLNINTEPTQHLHGSESSDESKADALQSRDSLENQLDSVVMDMELTFSQTSDRNGDPANKPNGSSDTQKNDVKVICTGPNQGNVSCDDKYRVVGNLSSEVSAIYLAMQHSKLECVYEPSQDSISTEGCAEPDDSDEFDDFDPYTFIKDLPDLSVVVPKHRPLLLPKQTRSCPSTTLVLDLDETLVHSILEPCGDADFSFLVNFNLREHTIYVRCRPYLKDFMERVSDLFETTIFTASQSIYAEQLLNVLDPKRRLIRHRVYRESCIYVDGNYLKDLSILGRDLAHVIIIDNSPQAFGFQLENGIPIESWFDDRNDRELLALLPFLESLVGVDDVRPIIAKKFNLRERVAASSSSPIRL